MKTIDLNGKVTGDGLTDNHEIIQNALNEGNCNVIIPSGIFIVSKTLKVFSHTKIVADKNSVVRLASNVGKRFDDWLLTNNDHVEGNADIEISGGIWDVNGKVNPRGERSDLDAYGGVGIYFLRMRSLVLNDLTVANSDSFFIMLCETEDFKIERVKIFNDNPKINQDGIHIGGFCRNGIIHSLWAISPLTPGDDMVALNANDGIAHFTYGQRPGPIENIEIEDLRAESAYTFVRLLSQDQLINNIRIKNICGGVRNNLLNINRWRFPSGGGNISNVKISDVIIHKMPWTIPEPKINDTPLCDINLKVKNLVIENFQRTMLDNGVGNTFSVDMGVTCKIKYKAVANSIGFEADNNDFENISRCSLKGGGFGYLAINPPNPKAVALCNEPAEPKVPLRRQQKVPVIFE
jgi:polygalacturonase